MTRRKLGHDGLAVGPGALYHVNERPRPTALGSSTTEPGEHWRRFFVVSEATEAELRRRVRADELWWATAPEQAAPTPGRGSPRPLG